AVLNFLCFFLCFKTKKEGTCPGYFSGSLELSLLLSLCQDKERRLQHSPSDQTPSHQSFSYPLSI
ncbi:MAG: hypothetical protein K6T34_10920, partial [Thermoflavifilum sp.]|nr:hypothetical protein [Thermoflavifilum sp.]